MSKVTLILAAVVVVVAGIVASSALFTVHQTSQALVLQFGNPVRIEREPGLKFKLPFVQEVQYFDRRILDLDPPSQEVPLRDQKRINVDAFARYRIVDPLEFRKKAFTDANFRQIFGAQMNAAVRAEVGRVLLADMLTEKRAQVMESIAEEIRRKAPAFGVEVVDVRIGRTDLPESTSQAVYSRMNSDRQAYAAEIRAQGEEQKSRIMAEADRERTVILAEATRQSQILRGEGEAGKNRILNEAQGQGADFYRFMRTMESYGRMFGDGTTLVLNPDSEILRYFKDMNIDAKRN